MGAPPLGDSPLVAGQSVGGAPPWWGAAPTNGGECWEEGGAPWGNTMDKGTCFLHVWWEHVFLVWWVHVLWAEFQPPSPLPPLYKEVERSSPSPLQLSHTSHA